MREFTVEFKDDNEKIIIIGAILGAIILSFISPLVVFFFLRDKIGEKSYELIKALLNFELLLFIICIVFFIIGLIPVIGWIIAAFLGGLVGTVLFIYNAVILLFAVFSITDKKVAKLPVPYEFV